MLGEVYKHTCVYINRTARDSCIVYMYMYGLDADLHNCTYTFIQLAPSWLNPVTEAGPQGALDIQQTSELSGQQPAKQQDGPTHNNNPHTATSTSTCLYIYLYTCLHTCLIDMFMSCHN